MIFSSLYANDRKIFSINFSSFFESIKKLWKKILP
jgi:hypothetical protein